MGKGAVLWLAPPCLSRERDGDVRASVINNHSTVAIRPLIPEIINYLIHVFHVFSVP